jgi:hypothetical protein
MIEPTAIVIVLTGAPRGVLKTKTSAPFTPNRGHPRWLTLNELA